MTLNAGSSSDPWRGRRFWHFVYQLEQTGDLDRGVRAALAARGYVGPGTRGGVLLARRLRGWPMLRGRLLQGRRCWLLPQG